MKAAVIRELEDILFGLKHHPELEPTEARISALEYVMSEAPNNIVGCMLDAWKEGHGVLSTTNRIIAVIGAWERMAK